jgi:hypothetical protein
VGEIFSDAYRFSIPRYQRPYAWTIDQAGEMLSDLLAASRCEHKLEDSDPYFLGSVVLVKREDDAAAEVVDGQQRLTTLTVLLSVAREFVPAVFAASLDKRLFQQGDPIKGTLDQPRLTLRDRDQPFLEKQILDRDGVEHLGTGRHRFPERQPAEPRQERLPLPRPSQRTARRSLRATHPIHRPLHVSLSGSNAMAGCLERSNEATTFRHWAVHSSWMMTSAQGPLSC